MKMQRVRWSYIHHLNSRSTVRRLKYGDYYGKVKHTIHYHGPQLAVVLFDGNKCISRVPLHELSFF